MRGPSLRVATLLAGPILLLAAFYAAPLATMLSEASLDGARWLATAHVRDRLGGAILQASLSTLVTLAIAIPLAWIHHARAIPMGRVQLAIHMAPFVLPVFVVVYGIQLTIGPGLPPLAAVVAAHAYYNYGFAARAILSALDRRPRRLEAAAATLGAPTRVRLWRVSLPLLAPSVGAVALLVFLFSFASFGTVLFLGAGTISTPETLLYQQLGGAFPRYERAAALGVLQLALTGTLFLGYLALLGRDKGLERAPPARRPRASRALVVASAAATLLALAPIGSVLVGGFRVNGTWTLEPWRALVDASHPAHLAGFDLPRTLWLTLAYAWTSMLLALALAALLAMARGSMAPRARAALDALTALPLGTSSLLLGFGYLLTFGAGALLDLRGTVVAIVLVHTVVATPLALRIILPAFDERDRRLDDAASLLGAGPWSLARRVHLPLLAGPLAAAAGLAAAASLGDFGASLLLMRPDNMSLAVWIGRHDAPFDPMRKAQAIALAGALALLAGAAYALLARADLRRSA